MASLYEFGGEFGAVGIEADSQNVPKILIKCPATPMKAYNKIFDKVKSDTKAQEFSVK